MDGHWLNPSSPYRAAAAVSVRLEALRKELAELFGAVPERLIFNSGATEGNNAVIRHFRATLPADARIVVSPIEHPSVLEPVREAFGERIDWLPLDGLGRVDLEQADLEGVAAVSLMAANNETGMLQPWAAMAAACRSRGIPFHCDASQWIGKMPLAGLADCTYLTGCAHKFGGPRGAGFLLVPETGPLAGGFLGGHQQGGRRAGTEDMAGAAALTAALKWAEGHRAAAAAAGGREALCSRLESGLPGLRYVGAPDQALWNTLSVRLPRFASRRWIRALERRGFLVSAGSACSTGQAGPSHVLAAMGLGPEEADRVLRISGGWSQSRADWEALGAACIEAYAELEAGEAGSQTEVISI